MALKGSKTEENLKAAFAGESQANRRYLYFAQKADVEGYNDVSAVFRQRLKVRQVMHMATLSIWKKLVILPPVNQLVQPLIILRQPLPVKRMSIQTCIQAWPNQRVKKVLKKLLIGLKH